MQSSVEKQRSEPAAFGEHFLTQEQVDSRFIVGINTRKHTHSREKDQIALSDGYIVHVMEPDVVHENELGLDDDLYRCLPSGSVGYNMQKKECGMEIVSKQWFHSI